MARYFNTTGPCDRSIHYMLPPEERLPGLDRFVARQQYFVVHAPRQTGKTTAMRAFADRLRERGTIAVYASLETSQDVGDVELAERRWVNEISDAAGRQLPPELLPRSGIPADHAPGVRLRRWLETWCLQLQAPLVLLLDEIDVVTGDPLVSFLRQLRSGFPERLHGGFRPASPWSACANCRTG